jgi:hypothetical protein
MLNTISKYSAGGVQFFYGTVSSEKCNKKNILSDFTPFFGE